MPDFKLDRIWRRIVRAHLLAYIATPTKRLLRRKLSGTRKRDRTSGSLGRAETQVDVLLVDSEPKALSLLASMLTSRGMTVMCTVDAAEAHTAAASTHPRVVVMSHMSRDGGTVPKAESVSTLIDRSRRPFLVALYREGDQVDSVQWDEWFLDPVEMSELAETMVRCTRSSD